MVESRSDVAVDESERNKKREPEAKRQHDRRGQRAGRVIIANREPQRHAPRVRKFFRARLDQKRRHAQQNKGGKRRAQTDQEETSVRGKNDKRRSKAESHGKRQEEIARPRRGPPRFDSGSKQGLNRHVVRTAERARGKRQRGQKAKKKPLSDRGRINRRRDRERNQGPECGGRDERQGGAERRAQRRPGTRDKHRLRQHQGEDSGPGRAQRLQDRDRLPLALDKTVHRIGNADAAHNQGGDPDEG